MTNQTGINTAFVVSPIYLPEDDDWRIIRTTEILNDHANAINLRDISIYDFTPLPTGQSWNNAVYLNNKSNSSVVPFRRIYQVTIAGTATASVAHGIVGLINCTRIYGTAAKSDLSLFIPLPQAAPDDVAITVDQTNINVIAATGTYNGFLATIILEFLENKQ